MGEINNLFSKFNTNMTSKQSYKTDKLENDRSRFSNNDDDRMDIETSGSESMTFEFTSSVGRDTAATVNKDGDSFVISYSDNTEETYHFGDVLDDNETAEVVDKIGNKLLGQNFVASEISVPVSPENNLKSTNNLNLSNNLKSTNNLNLSNKLSSNRLISTPIFSPNSKPSFAGSFKELAASSSKRSKFESNQAQERAEGHLKAAIANIEKRKAEKDTEPGAAQDNIQFKFKVTQKGFNSQSVSAVVDRTARSLVSISSPKRSEKNDSTAVEKFSESVSASSQKAKVSEGINAYKYQYTKVTLSSTEVEANKELSNKDIGSENTLPVDADQA